MTSAILARLAGLEQEVAVEEEEYSKDALAAAFGGKHPAQSTLYIPLIMF